MFLKHLVPECRNTRDLTSVEYVVGGTVAELLGRLFELRLSPSADDDLLSLRDEPFGHGKANATATARDHGGLKIESVRQGRHLARVEKGIG